MNRPKVILPSMTSRKPCHRDKYIASTRPPNTRLPNPLCTRPLRWPNRSVVCGRPAGGKGHHPPGPTPWAASSGSPHRATYFFQTRSSATNARTVFMAPSASVAWPDAAPSTCILSVSLRARRSRVYHFAHVLILFADRRGDRHERPGDDPQHDDRCEDDAREYVRDHGHQHDAGNDLAQPDRGLADALVMGWMDGWCANVRQSCWRAPLGHWAHLAEGHLHLAGVGGEPADEVARLLRVEERRLLGEELTKCLLAEPGHDALARRRHEGAAKESGGHPTSVEAHDEAHRLGHLPPHRGPRQGRVHHRVVRVGQQQRREEPEGLAGGHQHEGHRQPGVLGPGLRQDLRQGRRRAPSEPVALGDLRPVRRAALAVRAGLLFRRRRRRRSGVRHLDRHLIHNRPAGPPASWNPPLGTPRLLASGHLPECLFFGRKSGNGAGGAPRRPARHRKYPPTTTPPPLLAPLRRDRRSGTSQSLSTVPPGSAVVALRTQSASGSKACLPVRAGPGWWWFRPRGDLALTNPCGPPRGPLLAPRRRARRLARRARPLTAGRARAAGRPPGSGARAPASGGQSVPPGRTAAASPERRGRRCWSAVAGSRAARRCANARRADAGESARGLTPPRPARPRRAS